MSNEKIDVLIVLCALIAHFSLLIAHWQRYALTSIANS
jgi:hypothetical protein